MRRSATPRWDNFYLRSLSCAQSFKSSCVALSEACKLCTPSSEILYLYPTSFIHTRKRRIKMSLVEHEPAYISNCFRAQGSFILSVHWAGCHWKPHTTGTIQSIVRSHFRSKGTMPDDCFSRSLFCLCRCFQTSLGEVWAVRRRWNRSLERVVTGQKQWWACWYFISGDDRTRHSYHTGWSEYWRRVLHGTGILKILRI